MAESTEHPEASSYEHIVYATDQAVATIRFNRPECLNSFNTRMLEEFSEVLDAVRSDDSVRCLLLTGTGRGFCAGQDLSERISGGEAVLPDLAESLDQRYNPLVRTLVTLPVPVVCAVNGVAAGAGANIALACDIVIAARSARFIQAFCKIGLIPDAGGTWQLPRLVGRARALGLAMLGDSITADQAAQWGLIWRVIDDDAFTDEAHRLARILAAQPTRALGWIKQAINASATNTLDQQLDLERDLQGMACRGEDYREGLQAFIDKRTPAFKGN